jgi:hypothetical protein
MFLNSNSKFDMDSNPASVISLFIRSQNPCCTINSNTPYVVSFIQSFPNLPAYAAATHGGGNW